MSEMRLSELVTEGLARSVLGDASVAVSGVRHDSRAVESGDLFVAIRGQVFDGRDYSRDAVARGAAAVASEVPLELGVPVLLVGDALSALSALSCRIYGDPTAELEVIGITGTNGKTSVAFLIEQLLQSMGATPAVIGTVNYRGPGGVRPASHTTPMADDLMRLCRWAVDTGASHLVLEVSSHALAMQRADAVHYRLAAFTNLSQDHLDYHGDMARYGAAKARLFLELEPQTAVINVDDPFGAELAGRFPHQLLRCSKRADAEAEIRVLTHREDRDGIHAEIETPAGSLTLHSPLLGQHNLDNLLIAVASGVGLGFGVAGVVQALASAPGAPGRLERVPDPRGVLVFVDYAHTPDALRRVCHAVRGVTDGREIVVFGCGGDRDRSKRAPMGTAVAEAADIAIITSDNPRSELPEAIIEDVIPGVVAGGMQPIEQAALATSSSGYVSLVDRAQAIAVALTAAKPGDCVLIAGKGHETYQLVGDQTLAFDDRDVARRVIANLEASG